VHNAGDETAEAVQVIAELTVDGEVIADGSNSSTSSRVAKPNRSSSSSTGPRRTLKPICES
jgi:hypothetical protein